jgi:two-component system, LuxR family, sensor kinase FixL
MRGSDALADQPVQLFPPLPNRCDTFPAPVMISATRNAFEVTAARIGAVAEGGSAGRPLRTLCGVLASTVSYYVATQIAWTLTFPDSKVSLFFPPQAVLLCILLVVPIRHWWIYVLAAVSVHFMATQQAGWPPLYALNCEAFDAVKCVSAAAVVRSLIKSPLNAITLRDAVLFVLFAVVLVPFGTAFWGASFTVSYGFGTQYWVEWRNLGISNAVTTVVLVPAFLLGAHHVFARRPRVLSSRHVLEAALVGGCTVALGVFVFDRTPAGPNTSPALLYTPIPLLIWAALRFGLGGISASMLIITFQAIWGTMRGHGPFLAQTPAENATALQLFLLVTATPLMLLAVVIEEERRSKEALRESANLMGLAAEAGDLAMWVWDVSGNDVWMTERGRSLFGLEPGARLDFSATFNRVHPDDRAARESAVARALRTRGEYEMEYRVQQVDGATRWIHGRGRCVGPDDGDGQKLFGVSMDVTARKQAEAAAAQKRAELEHVARVATLGELTTTLTHELQQPLAAILTNTYVGGRLLDAPEPDLQKVRRTLDDIGAVTERAGEVIGGLRAMLKRDRTAAGLTDVDVNNVIRVVERIAHGDANRHKVTVDLDLSSDVRPVKGDSVQLQQVVLNLMLNAFSAMGGTRLNGARRLVVRTKAIDQSSVLVEVQDSGPGIAAEQLESVFDPFVTSKPDGLGMGLSICRSIIERHGGRISAANNRDGGATFSITLPATARE